MLMCKEQNIPPFFAFDITARDRLLDHQMTSITAESNNRPPTHAREIVTTLALPPPPSSLALIVGLKLNCSVLLLGEVGFRVLLDSVTWNQI